MKGERGLRQPLGAPSYPTSFQVGPFLGLLQTHIDKVIILRVLQLQPYNQAEGPGERYPALELPYAQHPTSLCHLGSPCSAEKDELCHQELWSAREVRTLTQEWVTSGHVDISVLHTDAHSKDQQPKVLVRPPFHYPCVSSSEHTEEVRDRKGLTEKFHGHFIDIQVRDWAASLRLIQLSSSHRHRARGTACLWCPCGSVRWDQVWPLSSSLSSGLPIPFHLTFTTGFSCWQNSWQDLCLFCHTHSCVSHLMQAPSGSSSL
jgi:hypothetical protein